MIPKSVNPLYFLVRINKQAQVDKKVGKDSIKLSETFTFGKAGMQCGELVGLGKFAKLVMPMAKVGGTLYFSWKVEYAGEIEADEATGVKAVPNMALVYEDLEYNYYTVTATEYKGRGSEAYAYEDETGFYTHPAFIILHKEEEKTTQSLSSASGLIVFENWKMTDDEIRQKIDFNTQHIYSLSITHQSHLQKRQSDARQTKEKIIALQNENKKLSEQLQKKDQYEDYTVKYCSPLHQVKPGDKVMAYNIFFLMPLTVHNEHLRIGPYDWVGTK